MKKNFLKIGLINGLFFVLGLIAVELIFGQWTSQSKIAQLGIPRNVRWYFDLKDLYPSKSGKIFYSRDKFGLRGNYTSPEQIDILTVGGSTTDQRYVDDLETWQSFLAEKLSQANRQVSIVNAGIDGQSTYGHIKNFELWFSSIPNLKPRYILFYIGINDFFKFDGSNFDAVRYAELSAMEKFKAYSAIGQLFRVVRGILKVQTLQIGHGRIDETKERWTDVPLLKDHRAIAEPQLRAYRARIEKLMTLSRNIGAHPIVVTQKFFKYKVKDRHVFGTDESVELAPTVKANGVDYFYFMDLFNSAAMEACRDRNGICIDLGKELDFNEGDYYDYAHTTPLGSMRIANYLAKTLQRQNEIHL